MTDGRLRTLLRRWGESGADTDLAAVLAAAVRAQLVERSRVAHMALLGDQCARTVVDRCSYDTVDLLGAPPRIRWWAGMAKAEPWLLAAVLREIGERSGIERAEHSSDVVGALAKVGDPAPGAQEAGWDLFQAWARRCIDGPWNKADGQRRVGYEECLEIARDILRRNTLDQIK